jgi:hypothetical protein
LLLKSINFIVFRSRQPAQRPRQHRRHPRLRELRPERGRVQRGRDEPVEWHPGDHYANSKLHQIFLQIFLTEQYSKFHHKITYRNRAYNLEI